MNKNILCASLLFGLLLSCNPGVKNTEETVMEMESIDEVSKEVKREKVTPQKQRPISFDNGKFFTVGERKMLYGGKDSLQHFDVTDSELIPKQFHYGIGREVFPALLKPSFISIKEADIKWADSSRFLVAYSGKEIKAYSVKDLTRHEVINDKLDGKPIMAAYCILADLGAVYRRDYGSKELTFALSGYTYYDKNVWDGLDGFVLWDRETESLWWPLAGRAVSGKLKGVKLQELNEIFWEDTDWKTIKDKYPTTQVLESGQDYERPVHWIQYDDVSSITKNYK